MKRFLSLCLVFVLVILLAVSVAATNDESSLVELTYWEWIQYYDLCDCDDHHSEYEGIKSYNAGFSDEYSVLIPFESYSAVFADRVENPDERNYEIGVELENKGDLAGANESFNSSDFAGQYGGINLGSLLTDYISEKAIQSIAEAREADSLAETSESNDIQLEAMQDASSNVAVLSANPVPDSGSAYTQPTLVDTEYWPDAESGSLLSVLYSILGKPVKSYTYSYRSSSSSSSQTVYDLQLLDYDIYWIASFFMLCLLVYCVFKAGGALLSKM